jgi:hypothetical protein
VSVQRPAIITKGLNEFTADVYNELWREISELQRMRPIVESLRREQQQNRVRCFWAAIRGHQQISANRWRYAFGEVQWDSTTERFDEVTGGFHSGDGTTLATSTDAFSSPAYNGLEAWNTGDGVESGGVDVTGDDYPTGFCLMPIRGDGIGPTPNCSGVTDDQTWQHAVSPVVLIHLHRDQAGKPVYVFNAMNQHDGTCETE